jgi:hypothetical protein
VSYIDFGGEAFATNFANFREDLLKFARIRDLRGWARAGCSAVNCRDSLDQE